MTNGGSSPPELPRSELPSPELPGSDLPGSERPGSELTKYVQAVLDLVDQIPVGMVLSYGDIAELLGEGGPRQVGSVLSLYGSAVTWWRVTRASGEVPRGLQGEALAHWRTEGTPLVPTAHQVRGGLAGGRVDMARARWDGTAGSTVSGGPGAGDAGPGL